MTAICPNIEVQKSIPGYKLLTGTVIGHLPDNSLRNRRVVPATEHSLSLDSAGDAAGATCGVVSSAAGYAHFAAGDE